MWKALELVPTLVAVMAAFDGWSPLMPVTPQAILDDSGGTSLADAYTGIFMTATVLTQTQTPCMCCCLGYSMTILISGLSLGSLAILHIFGTDTVLVFIIAALYGMGFGALTVAESTLIAELVLMKFLGKVSGVLGVTVGLLELIFLPLGLVIADETGSYAPIYVLGAVISLVSSLMTLFILKIKPAPKEGKDGKENAGDPVPGSAATQPSLAEHVATWKLVTIPALAINIIAMGSGGIPSFLAPMACEIGVVSGAAVVGLSLSVLGGTQMVLRYFAGVYADHKSEAGILLILTSISGFIGLLMVSGVVLLDLPAWLLLVVAIFYGTGFGIMQNEVLLLIFAHLSRDRTTRASAFWDMSFDPGTGIDSLIPRVVAAAAPRPYLTIFAFATALLAVGLIGATLDRTIGKYCTAEY